MFKPRLRITSVDHYGFNGREHHPVDSDIGLIVTPVHSHAEWMDNDAATMEELIHEDDHHVLTEALAVIEEDATMDDLTSGDNYNHGVVWFYTCVTEDGRILDLIDFEVEDVEKEVKKF